MDEEKSKSLDILGLKPIANAIEKLTDAAIKSASSILSRVCLPVAKEFGLLLQDTVKNWRTSNIVSMTTKLERQLADNSVLEGAHAHPRIASTIIEQASWNDDSVVQDLWAGLLAASCTEKGDDDSNLNFTDVLAKLTKSQARIMKHACETITRTGLIATWDFDVSLEELAKIAEESDIHRLDREVEYLCSVGILTEDSGLPETEHNVVYLTPTSFALHMYVRCSGSRESPLEFYRETIKPFDFNTETPGPPEK